MVAKAENMVSICCVHQGTEMYGSDRSFVSAVRALASLENCSIGVVIPHKGPILKLFEQSGIKSIAFRHLWVLRKAGLLRSFILGLPENLKAIQRAARDIKNNDITYVNTVLDFLLASIMLRQRLVVHVREIPQGFAMKVIRALLILAKAKVIFNSKATQTAFNLPPRASQAVVYNGFASPVLAEKAAFEGHRKLRILCIGRINGWKGQKVLVGAVAALPNEKRDRVSVRFVGGVYGDQTHFRDDLVNEIARLKLQNAIEMIDFVEDPTAEYREADVVVIPSILPEPFGRVAIEGMAFGCPVIASNCGGLPEIVDDGGTGYLVSPGDEAELAVRIATYLDQHELISKHGAKARSVFLERFEQSATDESIQNVMRGWLASALV
jgi:glycosyltransferase involved in cell wall biosynthesis